jgi:hypothetical protein
MMAEAHGKPCLYALGIFDCGLFCVFRVFRGCLPWLLARVLQVVEVSRHAVPVHPGCADAESVE